MPNKAVYEGRFESNLRHGHGKFTWPDGQKVYEGGWFADKRHGKGFMVEGGSKRACEFVNGIEVEQK